MDRGRGAVGVGCVVVRRPSPKQNNKPLVCYGLVGLIEAEKKQPIQKLGGHEEVKTDKPYTHLDRDKKGD